MRVKITLACTECKQRNYDTMKNKKNDPDRLEMKKYCRFCRKHTLHRETNGSSSSGGGTISKAMFSHWSACGTGALSNSSISRIRIFCSLLSALIS